MKKFPMLLVISALGVVLAAPVVAVDVEEEEQELREKQRDAEEKQWEAQKEVQKEKRDVTEARKDLRQDVAQAHRAQKVIGMKVKNLQGETLGEIYDLVLDFDNGQIAYVVISSGGVLGVGDTLHAVPWKALRLGDNMDVFVLNVDKAAWKNAPGFKQNDWPEVADQEWRKQLDSYYR